MLMKSTGEQILQQFFPIRVSDNVLSYTLGDGAVSYDQIQSGNPVWGFGIIGLMFLPNIVFVLWFLVGNKKKQSKSETLAKILVAGSVQLVTLIK